MRVLIIGRIALALIACAVVTGPAAAPARAAGGLVTAAPAQADGPVDRTIVRSRYITLNFDALTSPGPGQRIPLDLFPDFSVVAVFDRIDPNADGVTWVGHVEGVPTSTVTLVYAGGLMTGSVALPAASYRIQPAQESVRRENPQPGRELHLVSQLDQSAFPREAPPIEMSPPADRRQLADMAADSADFIDVMVLYTPTAQTWAGGATGITNLINLAVSETNTSYANSAITQRIRLVHTAQVPYAEVSSFSTNLTNLRTGVGALSGVAALRDSRQADLVTMLVHPTAPDACGIAYKMSAVSSTFSTLGFSVTDAPCVTPSYTFAHELGHNMGAGHDWYVDPSITPQTYAHGYANPAAGQRWRTIMAYNDLCTDQGFNCTRLLAWANPKIGYNPFCSRGWDCGLLQYWDYPGVPMGVPGGTRSNCVVGSPASVNCDADDHLTLNSTALTVANFRQSIQPARRPF